MEKSIQDLTEQKVNVGWLVNEIRKGAGRYRFVRGSRSRMSRRDEKGRHPERHRERFLS